MVPIGVKHFIATYLFIFPRNIFVGLLRDLKKLLISPQETSLTILYDSNYEGCQTVVTRSTSVYRTELSFCQHIRSLSSKVVVSIELRDFKRVCNTEDPRKHRFIILQKKGSHII